MLVKHELISDDSSIDITSNDGQCQLKELIREKKLGLTSDKDKFSHCSLSLSPWKIPEYQLQRAKNTAGAISQLFSEVSEDRKFLLESLADYQSSSGLLAQLKQNFIDTPTVTATHYNVSRQDFLLDKDHQWRLVESNSIAAGMGPFNQTVIEIQKQLANNQSVNFADNPAISLQSNALVQAASKLRNHTNPLIIFVVEKNEDNIHDQMMLAEGIKHSGGRVQFRTLADLKKELVSEAGQIILKDYGLVDLIYYRTGYNLDDYIDEKGRFEKLLQLRAWIEQHQVVVSPSINHQISTSKWIQMKLSELSIIELSSRFHLTQHQATMAAIALDSQFLVPQSTEDIQSKLSLGQWILKSQNEGGGNVYDNSNDFNDYATQDMDYILMKKINTIHRKEEVEIIQDNQLRTMDSLVSELGIFTLGSEHKYAGYLLRSKHYNSLEAGVHRGGGLLDTIAIN